MNHSITAALADLRERIKNHPTLTVAKASGVDVKTVRKIRNGLSANHEVETLIKIHNAIAELEKQP